MKLPSLQHLANQLVTVLTRFPLTVLSSILGAIAFSAMLHTDYPHPDWTLKLLITSFLALPLTLSFHLLAERYRLPGWQKSLLFGVGAVLMGWYYVTLSHEFDKFTGTRFFLFLIGLHLLVAFCPYAPKSDAASFWQYNKRLFLRILLAALYSFVLYGGMALALVAIDNLFDVNIKGEWYGTLASVVLGVFNTCFFLAGVPLPEDEWGNTDDYPKGLLLFTQFVLLPLVTVYLTILYFYSGKILLTQTLPKGWVSYLVLGFSIAGILSLLLIHPIRTREGNRWIQTFGRWFYLALFPLIVLLFVAIGERLSTYGITENRYFILLTACWLLGIALYMLLSQRKNIYWIPMTLSVLAFLASFGPWGAFSVSERSQLSRLDALLSKNNLLQNGKISGAGKKIPLEENKQISAIIHFFAEREDVEERLQPYFAQNLAARLDTMNSYEKMWDLHKLAQIEYVSEYDDAIVTAVNSYYFSSDQNDQKLLSVAGYDYMITMNPTYWRAQTGNNKTETKGNPYRSVFHTSQDSVAIELDSTLTQMKFYRHDQWLISLDIKPMLDSLSKKYPTDQREVTEEDMSLVVENEVCKLRVMLSDLQFTKPDREFKGVEYQADVLIGLKKLKKVE